MWKRIFKSDAELDSPNSITERHPYGRRRKRRSSAAQGRVGFNEKGDLCFILIQMYKYYLISRGSQLVFGNSREISFISDDFINKKAKDRSIFKN